MKIKGIKVVDFFGVKLLVDTDVYNYIACDENGDICGYVEKPNYKPSEYYDTSEWVLDDLYKYGEDDDDTRITYFGNYFNLVLDSKNIDSCQNEFYSMTDDLVEDASETLIKL